MEILAITQSLTVIESAIWQLKKNTLPRALGNMARTLYLTKDYGKPLRIKRVIRKIIYYLITGLFRRK